MASALPVILKFLPYAAAAGASALKGNKTKFTEQQSPQQKLAYTQLLQMLMRKNQQGSDPMNQVRQMFYGQAMPQQQSGMPQGFGAQARTLNNPTRPV